VWIRKHWGQLSTSLEYAETPLYGNADSDSVRRLSPSTIAAVEVVVAVSFELTVVRMK
jgi:hypothetical protein